MTARPPSGRFVLRLPPAVHAALQGAARASGLSLNEYCVRRLSAPGHDLALTADASTVVLHAMEVAGEALVGVVLYGSWARGEAGPASDVDALVIVEARLALGRPLYRRWDATLVTWQGRAIDPHFVHPPGATITGGVWGEVAVDGVVLFERGLRVSLALARIRRGIVAGRLVRRVVHGQPYWTGAV